MATKKKKPLDQLVDAARSMAVTRGEAQWTNGYRAIYEKEPRPANELRRLRERENALWEMAGRADDAFVRLARRLLRAAKKAKASPSKAGGRNT